MPIELESLKELCMNLSAGGIPKSEIKSNLGTLAVHLRSKSEDNRRNLITGPLFELFRWEHLREENVIFPDDSSEKVGDTYYRETNEGHLNVVQLKWATGTGKKVLKSNLEKALKQLKGDVQGNNEGAPEGAKSIARIGLQNISFDDAIHQVAILLEKYAMTDMVQVDVFDVIAAKKHTIEVSDGKRSVRSTDTYFATKEALPIWRTLTWSEAIFLAAEEMGHKKFAAEVTKLAAKFV